MTGIFSAIGDALEAIMAEPLLATFVIGIPLFGVAIATLRKFVRKR